MENRTSITIKILFLFCFLSLGRTIHAQELVNVIQIFDIPIRDGDKAISYMMDPGGVVGPAAFTFDNSMNLYIVDEINDKINIYNKEGNYLASISIDIPVPDGTPFDTLIIDDYGDFYLIDQQNILLKYSSIGQQLYGINCKKDRIDSYFIIAENDLILGIKDQKVI